MKKLLSVTAAAILFVSCSHNTTVDLGMIVSLTGNYSPLLITARNGAVLAAEEINENDGNIKINLIVEDDESNIKIAGEKARKLLDQDLQFLLLSITSAAYATIEQTVTDSSVLAISPTITSDEFRGKDDNFIRMTPDISNYGVKLAAFSADAGKKRVAIVYDSNNLTYAETLASAFRDTLNDSVGKSEYNLIEYNTLESPSFRDLGEKITGWSPEAVLIISSAFDAALICQHIRTGDPLILLAPWAVSEELIKNGGSSIENTVFFLRDSSGGESDEYKSFVSAYEKRFGSEPSFQSLANYDSVFFLYSIIKQQKNITPESVKKGIIDADYYKGVDQTYKIDEFGDCSHPLIPSTIKNGKIVRLR